MSTSQVHLAGQNSVRRTRKKQAESWASYRGTCHRVVKPYKKGIVRPIAGFAAAAWSPHTNIDVNSIES